MTAKQNKKMTHIVTWQIESKWAQTSLQMFISQTIWSPATSKWWKLASTVSGSGSCDDPFNTGSLRLSCNTYYITEGCQLAPCIAHANMKGDTYIYICGLQANLATLEYLLTVCVTAKTTEYQYASAVIYHIITCTGYASVASLALVNWDNIRYSLFCLMVSRKKLRKCKWWGFSPAI